MYSYLILTQFSYILLIISCEIYFKFDVNSRIDWCCWNSSSWSRYHVDRPSNGWFTRGLNYVDHCCGLVLVSISIDSFEGVSIVLLFVSHFLLFLFCISIRSCVFVKLLFEE